MNLGGSINKRFLVRILMGEAKRRKQQGLAPKGPKISDSNPKRQNLLVKYPRLPLYVGLIFAIYLIFDWIRLNSTG